MNFKPNIFKIIFPILISVLATYFIGGFHIVGEVNFLTSLRLFASNLFFPSELNFFLWVYIIVIFAVLYFLWSVYSKKTIIPD
jgi:hypothetical protein